MVPPGWNEEEEEEWIEDSEEKFADDDLGDDGEDMEYLDEDDDDLSDDAELEDEEEDELEALIDEGEALIEEGRYQEALDVFREAAERYNESAEAIFHVGHTAMLLFSDGAAENSAWKDDDDLASHHEEALGAFEQALALDPEYYPALNGQGTLHFAAGNVQAACEAWEQSLAIESDQDDITEVLDEARAQLEEG